MEHPLPCPAMALTTTATRGCGSWMQFMIDMDYYCLKLEIQGYEDYCNEKEKSRLCYESCNSNAFRTKKSINREKNKKKHKHFIKKH